MTLTLHDDEVLEYLEYLNTKDIPVTEYKPEVVPYKASKPRKGKNWTDEEILSLKDLIAKGFPIIAIAENLLRTNASIRAKAATLGHTIKYGYIIRKDTNDI